MDQKLQANITVARIEKPAQDRKQWKIHTQDGALYYAMPDIARYFAETGQYEITYILNDIDGKLATPLKQIRFQRQLRAATGAVVTPAEASRVETGIAAAKKQQEDLVPERIFVCGAINATLSNPSINPLEISFEDKVQLVKSWRATWKHTFAANKQLDPEMGDQIPEF